MVVPGIRGGTRRCRLTPHAVRREDCQQTVDLAGGSLVKTCDGRAAQHLRVLGEESPGHEVDEAPVSHRLENQCRGTCRVGADGPGHDYVSVHNEDPGQSSCSVR